jgi:hypothetical protein
MPWLNVNFQREAKRSRHADLGAGKTTDAKNDSWRGQQGTDTTSEGLHENPKHLTTERNLDVEIESEWKKKPDRAELRVATNSNRQ